MGVYICILSTNCLLKMRKAQGDRRSWRYLALKGLQYYDSRWVCLKWDMGYPDKKHGLLSSKPLEFAVENFSQTHDFIRWCSSCDMAYINNTKKSLKGQGPTPLSLFEGSESCKDDSWKTPLCSMGPLRRDDTSKGACFMLKYGSFIHLYPSICWKDHLQENQYISAVQ